MSDRGPHVAVGRQRFLEKLIGPPPSGDGDRAINAH